MNPKHTPGPWRATLKSKDCVQIETDDQFNGYVATVGADDTEERNGTIYEFVSKTGRANARLIAAAPDLLKALEDLLGLFEGLQKTAGMDAGRWGDVQQARAAIARVRGQ